MERAKYDGEETPGEEDRLLAHPYFGMTERQRTVANHTEKTEGSRKEEEADHRSDAGD
jgi:hypothetical protein